jgi:hypothetical protein
MLKQFTKLMALAGLATASFVVCSETDACEKYVRVAPRAAVTYYRPAIAETRPAKPVVAEESVAVSLKVDMPTLTSRSTITVFGKYFGPSAGEVIVQHGPVKIPCKIENWQPDQVTLTLPDIEIDEPIHAELRVILPSGVLAKGIAFQLRGGPDLVVNRLDRGIKVSAQQQVDEFNR